mgnify:CR=1 FL=1
MQRRHVARIIINEGTYHWVIKLFETLASGALEYNGLAGCSIGDKFCLSYVNFYIANDGIIAPSYGLKTDDEVKEKLQSYFPERKIKLVPIAPIAEGGGGIHCITQQQPS